MRKRSSRRSLPTDTTAILGMAGEQLAQRNGVPASDVRYAQYTLQVGNRWTIKTCWEIRQGDRWEEVIGHETPAAKPGPPYYEEVSSKPR